MCEVIVVTSGKGGVGKTTTSASLALGLANAGKKTAVIDFDVGLRNLDLVMGCERKVVYDFIQVIQGEANLNQALIKGLHGTKNLYVLAASQTKDKTFLKEDAVEQVINELKEKGFEYIICDSPAGIEDGALMALRFADRAIIVTNPEISSVRDSDRIIGLLNAKTKKAEVSDESFKCELLITRYDQERVDRDEMLSINDVKELLDIELAGVIPDSKQVVNYSNRGEPVIMSSGDKKDPVAGLAYQDFVDRVLGKEVELRHLTAKKKSLLATVFGG